MLRWIFFDLDGVLVDSREWHIRAFKEALINEGIKLLEKEHEVLDGLPTKTKLEILEKTHNISIAQKERILLKKQEVTVELFKIHLTRNESTLYLLGRLKALGIKMALCSNAVRETIELCLKQMEMEEFFEFTLSNQDVKEPKPSPEMYQMALMKAEVHPYEVLIIEDSPHGVKAALQTDCHVLEVKNSLDLSFSKIEKYLKIPVEA